MAERYCWPPLKNAPRTPMQIADIKLRLGAVILFDPAHLKYGEKVLKLSIGKEMKKDFSRVLKSHFIFCLSC